jgi:hypothetical protein
MENGLLLGAHNMRRAYQLGSVPEFGPWSGLDYFRGSLASPHECACIGFNAGARLDRARIHP